MKRWIHLFISFFIVFAVWTNCPKAYALAGLSESSSTFHYNDFADLSWGHPSDGCTEIETEYGSQYCFYLQPTKHGEELLQQWGGLQKISIPTSKEEPIVLIQSRWHDHWTVYNTETAEVYLETENFEEALQKWKSFGFEKPSFANARNLSRYFEETEESKVKNAVDPFLSIFSFILLSPILTFIALSYLSPLLVLIIIVAGIFFSPGTFRERGLKFKPPVEM